RKTVLAHVDEGWRGVDASHLAAPLYQVARDRLPGATSDVEDRRARRQEGEEAVEPGLLEEAATSVPVPVSRMPLINIHDSLRFGCHRRIGHGAPPLFHTGAGSLSRTVAPSARRSTDPGSCVGR